VRNSGGHVLLMRELGPRPLSKTQARHSRSADDVRRSAAIAVEIIVPWRQGLELLISLTERLVFEP
jgi:hypothetical protein